MTGVQTCALPDLVSRRSGVPADNVACYGRRATLGSAGAVGPDALIPEGHRRGTGTRLDNEAAVRAVDADAKRLAFVLGLVDPNGEGAVG